MLSDGEQRGSFPPASLRFPAPPPPIMNANPPRGQFRFYASQTFNDEQQKEREFVEHFIIQIFIML